jgi:hypothetical protein
MSFAILNVDEITESPAPLSLKFVSSFYGLIGEGKGLMGRTRGDGWGLIVHSEYAKTGG